MCFWYGCRNRWSASQSLQLRQSLFCHVAAQNVTQILNALDLSYIWMMYHRPKKAVKGTF